MDQSAVSNFFWILHLINSLFVCLFLCLECSLSALGNFMKCISCKYPSLTKCYNINSQLPPLLELRHLSFSSQNKQIRSKNKENTIYKLSNNISSKFSYVKLLIYLKLGAQSSTHLNLGLENMFTPKLSQTWCCLCSLSGAQLLFFPLFCLPPRNFSQL